VFAELLTWWQHPEFLTGGQLDTGVRGFPLSSSIYGECSEVSDCCESTLCSLPDLNSSKLIPFLRIRYRKILSQLGCSPFIGKSKFPSPYFESVFLTILTPLFHIIPIRMMKGRRPSTSEQSEAPFLHLLLLELKGVSLLPRPSIFIKRCRVSAVFLSVTLLEIFYHSDALSYLYINKVKKLNL